jgi:hypothetical protein
MTLEERVIRLEKQVSQMVPKKEEWVGPTVITQKTGWSAEDMRRARRNGSIRYKRSSTGGYRYLISSIIQ